MSDATVTTVGNTPINEATQHVSELLERALQANPTDTATAQLLRQELSVVVQELNASAVNEAAANRNQSGVQNQAQVPTGGPGTMPGTTPMSVAPPVSSTGSVPPPVEGAHVDQPVVPNVGAQEPTEADASNPVRTDAAEQRGQHIPTARHPFEPTGPGLSDPGPTV